MGMEPKQVEENESPTQKKLKAILRAVTTGDIEYETVIPQALLTLMIGGGVIFLLVQGREVPDLLNNALFIIIGFYFGSDYQYRREAKKGH